ncbi:hypothetical protein DXA90_01040 [Clostridiaceae bacterium OF09-1]|nr:hypothetical protein DXA90_01040 [Clostridiaceae bacterium OF09-1]
MDSSVEAAVRSVLSGPLQKYLSEEPPIYLHLSDKALLIEVGAQTNTLQEILNTMEPLSVLLAKVFGV